MRSRALVAIAAISCALTASSAAGQEPVETRTDSDPTRPVLYSLRPEFYKPAEGVWRMQFVARYDAAVVRKRRWFSGHRGMLLRFELPIASVGTPDVTKSGLGDAYGQLLLVPYLSGRFAFVAGSGLIMPTASDTLLGSGKWTLAPAVLPVWFIRGVGLAFVKFQNFTSIAGDADRPDSNFLLITPTFIQRVGRTSWYLVDTETKTDWQRDGRTGVKSGFQYGWILPNRIGIWIKPEVWWGPNRDGQWNIKTGLVWYRPNP